MKKKKQKNKNNCKEALNGAETREGKEEEEEGGAAMEREAGRDRGVDRGERERTEMRGW